MKNCDRNSLLACALKAASLPFDPNLGFTRAVPCKNTATFQIGYKGYVQLALRTGRYKALNSFDVREGEFIGRDFVSVPIIDWVPDGIRPEKLNEFAFLSKISYKILVHRCINNLSWDQIVQKTGYSKSSCFRFFNEIKKYNSS